MKSLDEIHDMIATAQVGDGDRLLDICQALLEQLRSVKSTADGAYRLASDASTYGPAIIGE